MSQVNLSVVLTVLFLAHLLSAGVVLIVISKKVKTLEIGKNNKFVSKKINQLKRHKLLVVLLPLIGPIVGFSMIKNGKSGVAESGLKVNDPGSNQTYSDAE